MSWAHVLTLQVLDVDGEEAVVIVDDGPDWVSLTLSSRHGGDVCVSLRPEDAEALIAALQEATAQARRS